MRVRWASLFPAAMLAVSFQAEAAVNITGVAVNTKGQTIVLSNKRLVVKTTAAGVPVQAKVTCTAMANYVTSIHAPPLPDVKFPTRRTFVSAKAGSKWYYLNIFSLGAPSQPTRQAVVALGIGMAASGTANCGAGSVTTSDAAGLLIYR